MPNVSTYIEKKRGCGFKKPGGLYLIGASAGFAPCCKLPFALTSCPCCGTTFKQARGFTWINSDLFGFKAAGVGCSGHCSLLVPGVPMGLMWVGETDYPNVVDFEREAAAIGVSKRLNVLPRNLTPGTPIALAHKKAVVTFNDAPGATAADDLVSYKPGVFMVFKMEKLQYVVKPGDTDETLQKLADRNVELITVVPEGTAIKIFQ